MVFTKPKLSRSFRQIELTVLWYFVDIFPVWSTCERNGFGYMRHLTFNGDNTCGDGSSDTQRLLGEDWRPANLEVPHWWTSFFLFGITKFRSPVILLLVRRLTFMRFLLKWLEAWLRPLG